MVNPIGLMDNIKVDRVIDSLKSYGELGLRLEIRTPSYAGLEALFAPVLGMSQSCSGGDEGEWLVSLDVEVRHDLQVDANTPWDNRWWLLFPHSGGNGLFVPSTVCNTKGDLNCFLAAGDSQIFNSLLGYVWGEVSQDELLTRLGLPVFQGHFQDWIAK